MSFAGKIQGKGGGGFTPNRVYIVCLGRGTPLIPLDFLYFIPLDELVLSSLIMWYM